MIGIQVSDNGYNIHVKGGGYQFSLSPEAARELSRELDQAAIKVLRYKGELPHNSKPTGGDAA